MNDFAILLPALVGSILMMIVHVPLGQEVLRRGIIFVDLSLAQLAATGAFIATLLFRDNTLAAQAFAFAAALLGGWLFMWAERKHKEIEETLIGCAFVLSATLILLLMSGQTHGAEHLTDLLAGQILFAPWWQVGLSGSIFVLAAVLLCFFPKIRSGHAFYLIIAAVITTSVQLAGVYLVFASLIFPAVGTHYIASPKKRLILEYMGESAGITGGLLASYFLDLSAGPAIVWGIAIAMSAVFLRQCRKHR